MKFVKGFLRYNICVLREMLYGKKILFYYINTVDCTLKMSQNNVRIKGVDQGLFVISGTSL